VGMKSKRSDDDNDDIEWEEAQPTGTNPHILCTIEIIY
jgi:hypothetical protein